MAKRYDPILCMMVEEKVNTKDGAYGTVLDYYNQMKGKSKSEVERILASAKGNPNAYLAYKEWKKRYDKAKDAKAKDRLVKVPDSNLNDSKACDKDLPAFGVSYISGYAGGGVNRTEREYFHTEHEANKRAAELKSKNIKGVSVKKYENFYHTKDESEKYAVIMKNSSGKEQYTQGWDLGSIRNWIKDNEKRGYRVTWKNFDSKTIDKAKDSNALDEAITTADGMLAVEKHLACTES